MHANFQISKLIFEGEDRFFSEKLCSKLAIFWQILTKIDNFEGSKILKNQNFKNYCIEALDNLSICLQKQKFALLDHLILKKSSFLNAKI